MSEPTTKAGKRLLEREDLNARSFTLITPDAVLAIETEARRNALVEVRAKVLAAGMFEGCGGMGCTEERNEELAAILAFLAPHQR